MSRIALVLLSASTLANYVLAGPLEETDNSSKGFTIQYPRLVGESTCAATLVKTTSDGTRSYRAILMDYKGESKDRCESAETSSEIVVIGEWANFSEASHLLEVVHNCVKSLDCTELSDNNQKIVADALQGKIIISIDYGYNSTSPWNFVACDDPKVRKSDKCVALNFAVKDGHIHDMRILKILN